MAIVNHTLSPLFSGPKMVQLKDVIFSTYYKFQCGVGSYRVFYSICILSDWMIQRKQIKWESIDLDLQRSPKRNNTK